MARVAVVTGGTRGIGAAISKALKAAGYKVAATYAGNDEVAQKFKAETGINVYKWDVSSYDACLAGLKQVEADLGPVDVLVNNAGITKDGMFHKMTPEQWYAAGEGLKTVRALIGHVGANLNDFKQPNPILRDLNAAEALLAAAEGAGVRFHFTKTNL